VAIIYAGGRRTAVAGDGTLLHDVAASSALPTLSLGVVPGGTHVTGNTLREVRLLADAPYPLLARTASVTAAGSHGLTVKLRSGPDIYFGDLHAAEAKWTAAAEVLADTGSAGAAYIDVTDPSRPVAGAGAAGTGGAASSTATTTGATGAATTNVAATTTTTVAGTTATTPAATAATATAPTASAGTSTQGG
jgi:hypothetical protein